MPRAEFISQAKRPASLTSGAGHAEVERQGRFPDLSRTAHARRVSLEAVADGRLEIAARKLPDLVGSILIALVGAVVLIAATPVPRRA